MGTVCSSQQLGRKEPFSKTFDPKIQVPKSKHEEQSAQLYVDQIQIGSDVLYKISEEEMTHKLHKNVVAIIWKQSFDGNELVGKGSGLLISRNLVLTSAHNFYNKTQKIEPSNVQIYLAPSGPLCNPLKIDKIYVPPSYLEMKLLKKPEVNYDYALIKLASDAKSGDYLSLKGQLQARGQTVSIFGYPSQKYINTNRQKNIEEVNQYGFIKSRAGIIRVQQNGCQFVHKVTTLPGQSGSAVIEHNDQKYFIVGIHKGFKLDKKNGNGYSNCGVRFTKQILNNLRAAAAEMKAQMFTECVEKVVQPTYNNVEAYMNKGREHFMDKEYGKAIECFRRVINLDKSNILGYYLLGNSHMQAKNIKQARDCFRMILQIRPNDSEAYYKLGNAYLQLRQYEQAKKSYKQAITYNNKHSSAHFNLGKTYQYLHKLQDAIKCLETAVTLKENDFEGWVVLASLHKQSENYRNAIVCYNEAIRIKHNCPQCFHCLGQVYQLCNLIPKAIQAYLKSIDLQYEKSYISLARLYEKMNQTQKAEHLYLQLINTNPNYCLAYHYLGLLFLKTNLKQEAIVWFKKAIEINKDFSEAYYSLGEIFQRQRKLNEAYSWYRQYLKLKPDDKETARKLLKIKEII